MISRTNDIFDFLERSLIPICILFLGLLGNLIVLDSFCFVTRD